MQTCEKCKKSFAPTIMEQTRCMDCQVPLIPESGGAVLGGVKVKRKYTKKVRPEPKKPVLKIEPSVFPVGLEQKIADKIAWHRAEIVKLEGTLNVIRELG